MWMDLEQEIPVMSTGALMSELPPNRRTIRKSGTVATLVDNSTLEKWELKEREPTLTELDRSFTAVSGASTAERSLVSRGEVSPVEDSSSSHHERSGARWR